jgi:ZIP family zinc transporter
MTPIIASIISISMIFLATTLGATCVLFTKKNLSEKVNNTILGFASGIMIAAAFFGLLLPSMEQSASYNELSFLPVAVGFILGGGLLFGLDRLVPHIHASSNKENHEEGIRTKGVSKSTKFFLAVTLHNIPEGLAVGFACGLIFQGVSNGMSSGEINALMLAAISLAIGISIQNIPEGFAVATPLVQNEGFSRKKAFIFGMLSGIVEPVFAIIALFISQSITWLMPWLLSFAAGAMVYAVVEDLMPDFQKSENSHYGIWALMIGFAIMMILEVTLS